MARWTSAIEVTFNDNDGKVGWRIGQALDDIHRHQRIFGKYRTRWIMFKRFWRALIVAEERLAASRGEHVPRWVLRAEIPE